VIGLSIIAEKRQPALIILHRKQILEQWMDRIEAFLGIPKKEIGRIYRLGQKKHIQVYNFVSESSIEHRILHLLDFKKAVFTGVLDEGGQDEVMLEGFMQSVRAMLDFNLKDPEAGPEHAPDEFPVSSMAAEKNVSYQQEGQLDTPINQGIDEPSRNHQEDNLIAGARSGFGKKLKRWLNRVWGFLTRKTE
jgi:hypothetical protein